MAFEQLARSARLVRDRGHARRGVEHTVHVHHLGHAKNLGPREHLLHGCAVEARSRYFDGRRRGYGGRSLKEASQRQVAAGFHGKADALDAKNIGQFVRVPEDAGGSLRNHDRCVMLRKQVRAFEVNVRVDEAGRDEAAGKIVDDSGVGARTGRMNACDHGACDPDIGRPDFTGDDIDDLAADEKSIEWCLALCSFDGTRPHRLIERPLPIVYSHIGSP